jgi:hypothetical protein
MKLGVVAPACNPILEAVIRTITDPGQPRQKVLDTLSQPCSGATWEV